MRNRYGNLRLWFWTLTPLLHLALVSLMVERMNTLLRLNYPAHGTEYIAFYTVPIDAAFDRLHFMVKQTMFLMPLTFFVVPSLLAYELSKKRVSSWVVVAHLFLFLIGWAANGIALASDIGKWWTG